MKMIIAAFCDHAAAQEAASYLRTRETRGSDTNIQLLTHDNSDGISSLRSNQLPRERMDVYQEVMRRGAVLLVARAPDDEAQDIADELDRRGSLDLDSAQER